MQKLAALLAALAHLALLPGTAQAEAFPASQEAHTDYGSARAVWRETWVEEWDPAQGRWIRVSEEAQSPVVPRGWSVVETRHELAAARYAMPLPAASRPEAAPRYGPFRVIDDTRAALVGSTDAATPGQFDAMLRDFPELSVLELVEAPGTSNDIANLALGRRIRAAGIATHVPTGGSVRSGAVELFLAGEDRTIEPGALFAVHSWLDTQGREADDFAPDSAAHRMYLDYYVEMGLSEERARAFYAMTNSVPHASALWLRSDEMRRWIAPEAERMHVAARRIAALAPALSFAQEAIALPEVDFAAPASLALLSVDAVLPSIDYADVTAVAIAWDEPGAYEV